MAAVSKIRADYEELTQIAQAFGRQAEIAQQVLSALQKYVNTLQGGDWVGKGADAFYVEMNSAVLPAMKRVVEAMNEAANTTTEISRIIKQAEDEAAALFRLNGSSSLLSPTHVPRPLPSDGSAALTPDEGGGAGAPATSVGGASGSPAPSGTRERTGGARDTRAEKVQPVLDEANRLKNKYDDANGLFWRRKEEYEEAVRLGKEADEVERLNKEFKAAERLKENLKDAMTKKYNEAIDLTVKVYQLDLSAVKGKPEYDHGTKNSGETDPDERSIIVGQGGVTLSPGWLASTLGHEAMHAKQMKEGRAYDENENKQGSLMNDVECYQWELDNADRNGLTPHERDMIRDKMESDYLQLGQTNQERVNRRIFKPA